MHAQPLPLRHDAEMLGALLIEQLATRHRGHAHGITAQALAARLGIGERLLRTLITRAREDGIAIVGTPETGYFVAETAAELEQCCAFLRSRALHSLTIEARLRKVALAELLGQLRVPT